MISISIPNRGDAEGINEVIKRSWYATYVNSQIGITKEDVDQMYAQNEQQQIEVFRKRIENPKDTDLTLIAKEDDQVVGVIRLVTYEDHVRVRTFYVDPSQTGKGIGTRLWNESLIYLPKDRPVVAWPTEHTKSVEFYKKIGFVPTGEQEVGEPMVMSGSMMTIIKMIKTN